MKVEIYIDLFDSHASDLCYCQRNRIGTMSYKSRYTLSISDEVPGLIVYYHFYYYISREHLSGLDDHAAVLWLSLIFSRNDDLEDQILHAAALDQFFDIGFDLAFMTGISMNYIPFRCTVTTQTLVLLW